MEPVGTEAESLPFPGEACFRDSEKLVVRMDSREYDALRAAVALRSHLPKAPILNSDAAPPRFGMRKRTLRRRSGSIGRN